uniref:Uncharacterized protein n=1 Tax=Marseillevirus LCMAC101 TaxID=2506602 RepID=A0A481YRF4_9VIRU|nr:MAG: hypothetical protein LCMAC101_02040 [Marseillevirus LCMAC101]
MDKEVLYRVAGRYKKYFYVECDIKVPMGKNVLEIAKDALEEQYHQPFGEQSPCEVTEIIATPKCEGCQIEACGQRDHMEHPDGCLHNPSDCDLCQMEIKNLIKLSEVDIKDNDGQTSKSSTDA